MSNNSYDNKVSEKAVWEGVIPQEDEVYQSPLQKQNQPQMMFCYKCNNVIPGDSKFCPYCQTELYVTCPKCGVKYSSQYPVCNQCGTNREEYLQAQKREQERKEAIEKENRRQKELIERKKIEAERQRKWQERERRKKYLQVNNKILETTEYKNLHSLFTQAFAICDKKRDKRNLKYILIIGITPFFITFGPLILFEYTNPKGLLALLFLSVIPMGITAFLANKDYYNKKLRERDFRDFIYKSNNYDEKLITSDIIEFVFEAGEMNLSKSCIFIYRKKNNLPINKNFNT